MTVIDLTAADARMCYKKHYATKPFPNHDSHARMLAYSAYDNTIAPSTLILDLEQATMESPTFFMAWRQNVDIPVFLHRPMFRRSTLGEVNTEPWFNKLYLLEGDVLDFSECPLARRFNERAFTKTEAIKVPKLRKWEVDDAVDSASANPYVSEVEEVDPPETYDELITRHVQVIPKEFVYAVIEGKNTARELLRLVVDHCGDDRDKLEKFGLFIEHLRVANTQRGRTVIARSSPPDVLLTPSGRAWVRRHVMTDLPGVFDVIQNTPSDTNTRNPNTEILEALAKSTEATQRSVEAISRVVVEAIRGQPTDKASPKTIEGTWPTTHGKLLKIMGVSATTMLPQIWLTLAKANKSERVGAFEGLLYQEAKRLHRGNFRFVVSNHQLKQVLGLQFESRGDLEKGVNIFNSVCLTSHPQAAAVAQYNEEDEWMDDAVTSLEAKKAHRKFKHANRPKTATQFSDIVIGYYIVLRVLFGDKHPLTLAYSGVFETVDELTKSLETSSETLAFERCLWGFHSRMDEYFETIGLPDGTIEGAHVPDLVSFANGVRHRNPLPVPDWIPTSGLKPGGPTKDQDGEKSKTKKKKEAENTAKNATIKHKTTGRVALVIEKRGHPPPHDDGSELCLTFHTKEAGCKHDCVRKHSHRDLTENESQKLSEYLDKEV